MLTLLLTAAYAQALEPCATPWLMPDFIGVKAEPLPPPPPAVGKALRNTYEGIPNVATSENFALWWGSRLDLSESRAEQVLEGFEASWDVQIDQLGHDAPDGTDDYLFNVYVGSTGSGTPDDFGAGGYYYRDSEGWPMVVVASATANDPDDYGRSVIAHEYYHAIQDETGNYAYSNSYGFTDGSWFWEASATWVVTEVFPTDPWHSIFLFGYLLVPEQPLNAFTYPDGSLDGYHQYGAFLFPRFLTEHAVEPSVIAETWKQGSRTGDPLDVLDELIADEGQDLGALFVDFAAHNVLWDYEHGETYQDVVESYAPYYPGEDHRLTDTVRGDGDSDWFDVDEDLAPARLGYNLIRFEWPDEGDLELGFDGDSEGTEGTASEWGLSVVFQGDDGNTIQVLDPEAGVWRFEDVGVHDTVTLVVGAVPGEADQEERFPYSWRMAVVEPLPDPVAAIDPGGEDGVAASCGCAQASPRAAWPGLVLLGVLLGVRRREPPRS